MKSTIKWLIVISVAVCVNGQSNLGDDINQSDQVILSTDASISLSKCCPDHKLYRPGLDLCRHGLAESRQVTLLPVHSIKTDHHTNFSSPVTFLIEPNDNRMLRADPEKRDMLVPCPAGFVAKSSMNFILYEDSSIETDKGLMRKAGNFCVNAVYPSSNNQELQYAVRYCEPDECHNESCLRKCCPIGMVVNEVDKTCEMNSIAETFAEDVKQIFNVDQSKIRIVGSYGVGIGCQEKHLMPMLMNITDFHIFEDGQLYASDYPCSQRFTRLYCVDQFVRNNVTVSLNKFVQFVLSYCLTLCYHRQVMKGLRCFPQYKQYKESNATIYVFDVWPSFRDAELNSTHLMAHSFFPYLLFTSSGFLIVTFGVYAVLPEMRNTQGITIIMNCTIISARE